MEKVKEGSKGEQRGGLPQLVGLLVAKQKVDAGIMERLNNGAATLSQRSDLPVECSAISAPALVSVQGTLYLRYVPMQTSQMCRRAASDLCD